MNQKTFIFAIVIVLVVTLGVIFVQELKKERQEVFHGLRVGASFYPLAEFAGQVGKEHVKIHNFTPSGVDPHFFEPTTQDIRNLFQLDAFIFIGGGFEAWAEKMEDELEEKGVRLLEISGIIEMNHFEKEHNHDEKNHNDHEHEDDHKNEHDEGNHKDHGHSHDHGEYDPHFWLDPILAAKTVEVIRDVFIEMDRENEDLYTNNSRAYLEKLAEINTHYQEGLAECELREIIVPHNAFSYLGARYDIKIHAIAGLSHHEEPSPKRMAELISLAKEKNINHIFFEAIAAPDLAETIAREIGAETLILNPIEGLTPDDEAKGKNYLNIMEENLKALRQALSCQ